MHSGPESFDEFGGYSELIVLEGRLIVMVIFVMIGPSSLTVLSDSDLAAFMALETGV